MLQKAVDEALSRINELSARAESEIQDLQANPGLMLDSDIEAATRRVFGETDDRLAFALDGIAAKYGVCRQDLAKSAGCPDL